MLARAAAVVVGAMLAAAAVLPAAERALKLRPAAWAAPRDAGLVGAFERNAALDAAVTVGLGGREGPEALTLAPSTDGAGVRVATGTDDGEILVIAAGAPGGAAHAGEFSVSSFGNTGGRPLGLQFGPGGELYVADAMRGLLLSRGRGLPFEPVCDAAVDGSPVAFADDLEVAADGTVYFSDASTKFSAGAAGAGEPWEGNLLEAFRYELIEQVGNGRIVACDPATGRARSLVRGLVFPNGITLTHDGAALLFAETGRYAIRKHHLTGPDAGTTVTLIDNLPGTRRARTSPPRPSGRMAAPSSHETGGAHSTRHRTRPDPTTGFPDNIQRGVGGRYWIGLVSRRSALLDALGAWPRLRALSMALPAWTRPRADPYGHVVAIDDSGSVLESLQGDRVSFTVGALETESALFISRLQGDSIAILPRDAR